MVVETPFSADKAADGRFSINLFQDIVTAQSVSIRNFAAVNKNKRR